MDEDTKRAEEIARDYVNEVKKHINVDRAVIYGSYAKGTFNKDSDLDIAIVSGSLNNKKFRPAHNLWDRKG